jgi:hypothetical protein
MFADTARRSLFRRKVERPLRTAPRSSLHALCYRTSVSIDVPVTALFYSTLRIPNMPLRLPFGA